MNTCILCRVVLSIFLCLNETGVMGEKYDSERKQVILSPTELKDNV